MDHRRNGLRISLNELLIILLFVIVVIFPNATLSSRICKVVYGSLGLLYVFSKRKILLYNYVIWLIATCLLAVFSIIWSISTEYAIDGAQTVVLNGICAFIYIQLLSLNVNWKATVFRCCAIFPIFRFCTLFFTYGTDILTGLRSLEESSYNAVGFFAGLGVAFSILIIRERKKSIFWKAVLVLDIIVCVLSMSRKGIIYLAVPPIAYYFLTGGNFLGKLRRLIIIIVTLMLVWCIIINTPILYEYVGNGLESIIKFIQSGSGDASATGRSIRISYGIEWFKERPFLGYGVRNYNYMFAKVWSSSNMVIADNNFIDILVNYGIVGFIIYYYLHFKTIIYSVKRIKYFDKDMVMLGGIFLALLICHYGVSSYIYLHSQIYLATVIYGIGSGCNFDGLKLRYLSF